MARVNIQMTIYCTGNFYHRLCLVELMAPDDEGRPNRMGAGEKD